jgi:hypothetical protein
MAVKIDFETRSIGLTSHKISCREPSVHQPQHTPDDRHSTR